MQLLDPHNPRRKKEELLLLLASRHEKSSRFGLEYSMTPALLLALVKLPKWLQSAEQKQTGLPVSERRLLPLALSTGCESQLKRWSGAEGRKRS